MDAADVYASFPVLAYALLFVFAEFVPQQSSVLTPVRKMVAHLMMAALLVILFTLHTYSPPVVVLVMVIALFHLTSIVTLLFDFIARGGFMPLHGGDSTDE